MPVSEIYTSPNEVTTIALGKNNDAEVAGPPSPSYVPIPVPANLTMIPFVNTCTHNTTIDNTK